MSKLLSVIVWFFRRALLPAIVFAAILNLLYMLVLVPNMTWEQIDYWKKFVFLLPFAVMIGFAIFRFSELRK
jgi:hypothetical protein